MPIQRHTASSSTACCFSSLMRSCRRPQLSRTGRCRPDQNWLERCVALCARQQVAACISACPCLISVSSIGDQAKACQSSIAAQSRPVCRMNTTQSYQVPALHGYAFLSSYCSYWPSLLPVLVPHNHKYCHLQRQRHVKYTSCPANIFKVYKLHTTATRCLPSSMSRLGQLCAP